MSIRKTLANTDDGDGKGYLTSITSFGGRS